MHKETVLYAINNAHHIPPMFDYFSLKLKYKVDRFDMAVMPMIKHILGLKTILKF